MTFQLVWGYPFEKNNELAPPTVLERDSPPVLGRSEFDITDFDITESDITNLI